MKKKSFFNGYNAKLALAVVALSGALLTGCYKDDGLDVNGPAGEVILPDPVYTISGNVLDAETLEPIATASVSGDATATVSNGGFSVEVKDAKSYSLKVKANGYEDTDVVVDVKKVNAGQSAVYTTLVAMQPKYEGKYTLKVVDTELGALDAADWKVTTLSGDAVTSPYAGGATYLVTIAKEGYVTKYITMELPKTRTDKEKILNVTLTKQVIGKVKIYGDLTIDNKPYEAKSIKLKNKNGVVLGIGQGWVYNFEVEATEFAVEAAETKAVSETKVATFTFEIVDINDIKISFEKKFTIVVAPDGSVEGSDSEQEAPIEFKVEVTPESNLDENWSTKVVKTVDWCNDDTKPHYMDVEYLNYTGMTVEGGDYKAKLASIGLQNISPLYIAVEAKMTVGISDIKEETIIKKGEDGLKIPALHLMKTMTIFHPYNKVVRTLTAITVGGVETSSEELKSVYKANNILKQAVPSYFEGGELYSIEHSHSHGHGHGDNQNSGGGIVEAE